MGAMEANTGTTHGLDAWREGRERQAVLRGQTERLASVLEHAGIPTRLPCEVVMVGEVTGATQAAEAWRSIRFLPVVAQRDRRPVLNGLAMWLRGPEGRHARYAVVTSGVRVPLGGDLKKRQAEHTANIRRWSSEASQRWGVELLFRATEFTTADEGVHLHSNVVYRLSRRLTKKEWRKFLKWSRTRLRAHWKDCGPLKDASEVVKYCMKPAELETLSEPHLVWLFEQTYRAKLCQPLGAFADWMAGLDRDRLKVAMVKRGKVSRLCLVSKSEREPSEGGGDGPGENVLCGRTLPQARWCPYAEPVSLVLGYTETPTTPAGVRRLAALNVRRQQARGWWDAAGAPDPQGPDIRVHTDRPTVQATMDALSTLTLDDGTVIDRDTGEVLFEPPDNAAEARQAAADAARDEHARATEETADRLAAWRAAAPAREAAAVAREAAAVAAEVERRLRCPAPQVNRPVTTKRGARDAWQAAAYESWMAARTP